MAQATHKQPLILVSQDYDPDIWRSLDEEESEFQSWFAVAQDIWGRGCYLPGQAEAVREGASGLTIGKAMTVAAVGCTVGGLGPVAIENAIRIEVFESDAVLLKDAQAEPDPAGKLLRLTGWDPKKPELPAARYDGLMALRAVSASPDPVIATKALAAAVKPGGRIFIDELYASDPSAAALVAQGIAGPTSKIALHDQRAVLETLEGEKLEPRATSVVNEQMMAVIRAGLSQAVAVAQSLRAIPQPFRRQRMSAFADELQRAATLHQAIEKGLVTALRTIHYKPA